MEFKLKLDQIIEADSAKEAKEKFINNLSSFVANAEIIKINNSKTISIETLYTTIKTTLERIIYRDKNGDEINSIITNQIDQEYLIEDENIISQEMIQLDGTNQYVSDEAYDIIKEHIKHLTDNYKEIMEKIDVLPF